MWHRDTRKTNSVIWILSLVIFIAILWSYFAEIQQVVHAEGKVVPTGQNKLVQHLEGGIISEILIKEGDIVEKGQILFRIKNAFVNAELNTLEIEHNALRAKKIRLNAQLTDRKKLNFPSQMTKNSPNLVNTETNIFQDSYHKFTKEQQVLTSVLKRKEYRIGELTSQRDNLNKELNLANKELKLNEKLLKSGAASERDVLDSQKKYQSIKTRYDNVENSIPTARSEVKEAQGRIEQSKADYILNLREELKKTEVSINKIVSQQKAKADQQQRTEIISTVKGIVNKIAINTVGGIIRSGDVLASITPLNTSLIIEAKIGEAVRSQIWVGQNARVKLRAYDSSTFGSLPGKINFISPDSFQDERRNIYYYRISIAIDQQLSDDKPILPGMISDIDILAEKKSVFRLIIGPITKAWGRALTES